MLQENAPEETTGAVKKKKKEANVTEQLIHTERGLIAHCQEIQTPSDGRVFPNDAGPASPGATNPSGRGREEIQGNLGCRRRRIPIKSEGAYL